MVCLSTLPEQKVVNVSTAQGLVDAIANDTRTIIDSKNWLSWDYQIDKKGISNLTIEVSRLRELIYASTMP